MKRLTLLVCLVAVPLAIFATAHEPYQGDFDLDGDVDFTDFLTFASNYGKTGGEHNAKHAGGYGLGRRA